MTEPAAFRGDAILDVLRGAGFVFARLELTRNRRVMVSTGDGGSTLRLHECFLAAPAEVLVAAAQGVASRGAARRAAARSTVREYLRRHPPASAAPRRTNPVDAAHLARLEREFDRVNTEHFGGGLPRVPLHLSGRMRSRNGHFSFAPLEIVVSRALCARAAPGEAERTLRHEMIHLWQYFHGSPLGHDAAFRRWAERLDVHPRATRDVCWDDGLIP